MKIERNKAYIRVRFNGRITLWKRVVKDIAETNTFFTASCQSPLGIGSIAIILRLLSIDAFLQYFAITVAGFRIF